MLCRRLERELNASNIEIERLTSKVAQLYEGAEEQNQRIKRLEGSIEKLKDAGDLVFIWLLYNRSHLGGLDVDSALREWKQSKNEANL
jgi:septal ring factor EnvC (AmiA/AmiB activator)